MIDVENVVSNTLNNVQDDVSVAADSIHSDWRLMDETRIENLN
jgi:hypothetical protein